MGFGKVTDVLGKGLNIVNKLNGLLNCKESGAKCHEVESWTLNKGNKNLIVKRKNKTLYQRIDKGTKKLMISQENLIKKLLIYKINY